MQIREVEAEHRTAGNCIEEEHISDMGPDREAPTWELLQAYQDVPEPETSSRLLARLGPWLSSARGRLVAAPPYLDGEDVVQQLTVEVLKIAARWQPNCDENWIARRLVEDAERRVRQRLRKERHHVGEELTDELPSHDPEPELRLATPIGNATAADLRVIYRVRVLGEPVTKLASEAGVTPRQMRQLVRAAIKRATAPADAPASRGVAE